MKPPRLLALALTAGLAVALVGCSSDSSSTTSTTTSKEAVCAARKKLESSVKSLSSSATFTDGGTSIKQSLQKVKKDLDALGSSVKADLQPEVDAVKSAIDDLQKAVANIGDGSITENVQTLGTAIGEVGSTTGALTKSLNAECPS